MQKQLLFALLSIILVFSFINPTESKIIKGKIKLSEIRKAGGFKQFARFGVDIGEGNFTFKTKLNTPIIGRDQLDLIDKHNEQIQIQIITVLDREYEKFEPGMTCQQQYELSRSQFTTTLQQNGLWSNTIENRLTQSQRQHMWYFGFGICDYNQKLMTDYDYIIRYEFEITNNGSHFSSEETYMQGIYVFSCIASLIGILFVGFKYSQQREKEEPLFYIILSFALLFLQVFFYYLHLSSFSYDGKGSRTLQIFSALCETGSQTVLLVLLIQLAWGWTITYERYNKKVIVPIFGGIALLKLFLMYIGFLSDNELKYHNYTGWVGILTILIRFGAAGYFVMSLLKTMETARQKIKDFTNQLFLWGTLYIVSLPIAVMIGSCLAYYLQYRFIVIFNLIFQIQGLLFLGLSFLSKNSGYQKVAMKNKTELPTGFGYGSKYD